MLRRETENARAQCNSRALSTPLGTSLRSRLFSCRNVERASAISLRSWREALESEARALIESSAAFMRTLRRERSSSRTAALKKSRQVVSIIFRLLISSRGYPSAAGYSVSSGAGQQSRPKRIPHWLNSVVAAAQPDGCSSAGTRGGVKWTRSREYRVGKLVQNSSCDITYCGERVLDARRKSKAPPG